MKVSIIITSKNSSRTIERTLKSVYSQNYKNIEIIFIDAKSNDNTLDIIKRYKNDFLDILISEPDLGIYDGMNKGVDLASGELIFILNSDDELSEINVIERVVERFRSQPQVDVVCGDVEVVSNRSSSVWRAQSPTLTKVLFGWHVPHPGMFVKRAVYETHGFFDTTFSLSADYDFMLRVALDRDMEISCLSFISTRMHVGGVTSTVRGRLRGSFQVLQVMYKNGLNAFIPLAFFFRYLSKFKRVFYDL